MGKLFRRDRGAEGAAAVEFALVMPILFLVMFGIIQYGLWFNDSLNVRHGVREGARQGALAQFTDSACTSGGDLDKLACKTSSRIDALTGTAYVRVKAASWTKGQAVTVCALVKSESVGLLPMPNSGWIFSRTQMSIEQVTPAPGATTGSFDGGTHTLPAWPTGCT